MKNRIPYFAVLLAIALSACKEKSDGTEAKVCEKAAMELYCKYADNTNLTVAYLGDLSINEKSIDALMLQANNEADWETLKQDLGLVVCDTANVGNGQNDDKVVSVGIGIETAFLDESVFDTLTDISQIPEADLERFTLIVAEKIREIMDSFQAPDSLLTNTDVIIGQAEVEPEATENTYDDYLLTMSRTVVVELINENIKANALIKNGDVPTSSTGLETDTQGSLQKLKEQSDRIMNDAQSHGHIGYITAADHDNRTLWLFFYDDQEECNTIIAHIREDIVISE